MTGSRRRRRGRLLVAAIAMMALASALTVGALVARIPLLIGGAAVVSLAAGWCGLRLAYHALREERAEHGTERAALSRSHGATVAAMTAQHADFVRTMRHRLEQRDRRIAHLEDTVTHAELRAVEAESSSAAFRRQLDEAEEQIAAMAALMHPTRPPAPGTAGLRETVVPEWARLESEPTAALMAWETHAHEVAGRHRQVEDPERARKQA